MKKLLAIIIILLPLTAHAEKKWFTWDRTNTALHVPLTILYWVDYKQTVRFTENNIYHETDKYGWKAKKFHYESNTILGPNPSRGDIDKYFIGSYALTTALIYTLPDKWSYALQSGVIAVELYAIDNNYRAGIGIRF